MHAGQYLQMDALIFLKDPTLLSGIWLIFSLLSIVAGLPSKLCFYRFCVFEYSALSLQRLSRRHNYV